MSKEKTKGKKKVAKRKASRDRATRASAAGKKIAQNTVSIDDVMRIINHVQVNRENAEFVLSSEDVPVVTNILRDAGLPFNTEVREATVKFVLEPGPERDESDHILSELEELDDEILEDGQLF